jgi:hypothetical protein
MNYDIFKQSLQKLIGYYTNEDFAEELALARKEFFDNTGSLDENRPNYNLRMHQFYEWYFLTRPLKGYMKTPLAVCDQHRSLRLTDEDTETIALLLKTHEHSLFEYIKAKNDVIFIKNLMSGEKIEVQQDGLVFGFDSKEYFQARVVEVAGKRYFLDSFCFHPESSQKFILAELKTLQKNADLSLENFLLRLNKMRYKFEQYKHVKPELIYTNENKLGL